MDELLTICKELSEYFPDEIIFIGGIATYLHAQRMNLSHLAETSHDGAFYIALSDFADFRDIHEITPNRKLTKHQLIKKGWPFDIYVEKNHRLAIPFDEINQAKITIDGIPCAALEHLIILTNDCCDRVGISPAKASKYQRDLILLKQCQDQKAHENHL